jgi:hypothetical protein
MAIRVILDIDQQYWNRTDNFAQLGAAAGLVGDILIIPNVEAYTYFETGYRTNVSCATNTTSAFCINPPNETRYEYLPIDYVAIIILPNSNVSDIYTCSYTGRNTVNLTVPTVGGRIRYAPLKNKRNYTKNSLLHGFITQLIYIIKIVNKSDRNSCLS